MKTSRLRHWSTPAVIGAGLFVSISGVMMFFGVRDPVERAHEWIGMVFAAAILLHIVNHWRGIKSYFSQPLALGVVGAVAVATAILVVGPGDEGGHGAKGLFHRIEGAPLTTVAPLLDESPDQMLAQVKAAGFRAQGAGQSIAEIAADNGVEPRELVHLLLD